MAKLGHIGKATQIKIKKLERERGKIPILTKKKGVTKKSEILRRLNTTIYGVEHSWWNEEAKKDVLERLRKIRKIVLEDR